MQLIKKLIPFAMSIMTAYILLQPQKAFCQYSDSTIREINERLIELHECREKQALYIELAHRDSISQHKQAAIITNQEKTISHIKGKNQTLKQINMVQFALLVLALIL